MDSGPMLVPGTVTYEYIHLFDNKGPTVVIE